MFLEEKLRILKALMGKLLTLASSRDLIEDCVEDQRSAKQELREIRSEQHRRDREEAALRYTHTSTQCYVHTPLYVQVHIHLESSNLQGPSP